MFAAAYRLSRELIVNPGRVARRHPRMQTVYKQASDLFTARRRQRLRRLAATLPAPAAALRVADEAGFRVLSPGVLDSAVPLVARCQRLIGQMPERSAKKAQLHSLIGPAEVGQYPEFLDFCLDLRVLGTAAAYLGELPMLASVEFWHSTPTGQELANSQLYHVDLDDVRQFKVFLFVADVDEESGPLTVLRADVSQRLGRQLGYRPRSGHVRILDADIHPLLAPSDAQVLTGPSGTVVFVDTSRVLHFGSRVARRDRYVVMIQFLTSTNFMRNPFHTFEPWPYAHLARPSFGAVQRAVLGAA
jgi:hypothetical protein